MTELPLPFVSVIVPTYNRPAQLADCLEGMAKLDYPKDLFEVIVVDDGSTHVLDRIVGPFAGRIDVKLLRQDNTGPAAARNFGARSARGVLLAFTDDDCSPDREWLRCLAAQHQGNPKSVIGGKVVNALSNNPYAAASQILTDYLYEYYNTTVTAASFFTSNNLAAPRGEFLMVGGFDASFLRSAGEDREFCNRWLHLLRPMIYAPDAVVAHSHRMNFFGFFRQHFNYGWGAFKLHKIKADLKHDKIRLEPPGFYLRLLLAPFRVLKNWRALPAFVLISISQLSYALGFFLTTAGYMFWGSSQVPARRPDRHEEII